MIDVLVWGLALFFAWLLIWGIGMWGRQANDRKTALAWMFLTFEDQDGEKLTPEWMKAPGKHSLELEAWRMSREMRARLRKS